MAVVSSTISTSNSTPRGHQEFCGLMKNPMSLRAFPFDTDFIEIFIHQSEASTRDDYIFRPFDVRRRRRRPRGPSGPRASFRDAQILSLIHI